MDISVSTELFTDSGSSAVLPEFVSFSSIITRLSGVVIILSDLPAI
jgi:hypothetical protein